MEAIQEGQTSTLYQKVGNLKVLRLFTQKEEKQSWKNKEDKN